MIMTLVKVRKTPIERLKKKLSSGAGKNKEHDRLTKVGEVLKIFLSIPSAHTLNGSPNTAHNRDKTALNAVPA